MVIRRKLSIFFTLKASRAKVGKAAEFVPPEKETPAHGAEREKQSKRGKMLLYEETAERGKHTSRLELVSSIIQKD